MLQLAQCLVPLCAAGAMRAAMESLHISEVVAVTVVNRLQQQAHFELFQLGFGSISRPRREPACRVASSFSLSIASANSRCPSVEQRSRRPSWLAVSAITGRLNSGALAQRAHGFVPSISGIMM